MVEVNTQQNSREIPSIDGGQKLYEYYKRVIDSGGFPTKTYARRMRAIEAMAEVSDPKYKGGIFPGFDE